MDVCNARELTRDELALATVKFTRTDPLHIKVMTIQYLEHVERSAP
jgi:hypothetical protein